MPYCVKCKKDTDTNWIDSHPRPTRDAMHYFVTGSCKKCGTKKSVFTDRNGNYRQYSDTERANAKLRRHNASIKRKALKIGYTVMENDAIDCVKKCIKKSDSANRSEENTPVSSISASTTLMRRGSLMPVSGTTAPVYFNPSKKRRMD
jgi:hypothetical protein